MEIYLDLGEDGIPDGSALTSTGNMVQGQTNHYVVCITVPTGAVYTDVHVGTVTATSVADGATDDDIAVTTTVTVPFLVLEKWVNEVFTLDPTGSGPADNTAPPGATLFYTIVVSNMGSGAATSVVITDAGNANTTYDPGPANPTLGSVTAAPAVGSLSLSSRMSQVMISSR